MFLFRGESKKYIKCIVYIRAFNKEIFLPTFCTPGSMICKPESPSWILCSI